MLDVCILHPKLIVSIPGAVHTHGLLADLEFLVCQLLKRLLVLSSLHIAQFHQSSFFINLDDFYYNTVDMMYINHSSDDIEYYMATNIIQLKSLASLTQNLIPFRYTSVLHTPLHNTPNMPRSLSKSS